MSDFLGNVAARSLGRANVLRPLPQLYGARSALAAPVEAPDNAQDNLPFDGTDIATPIRHEPPYHPKEAPSLATPSDRESIPPLASAILTPLETFTVPASTAPFVAGRTASARLAAVAASGGGLTQVTRQTEAQPAGTPQIMTAPQASAAGAATPRASAEPPRAESTPASAPLAPAQARNAVVPVAEAAALEVSALSFVVLQEEPLRQTSLPFHLPELARPRDAQAAAATLPQHSARRAPPPDAAPAEPPPVSVTIGRLEVRVTPQAPLAAKPAPATPTVQSLEDYLRSRGRGGEP